MASPSPSSPPSPPADSTPPPSPPADSTPPPTSPPPTTTPPSPPADAPPPTTTPSPPADTTPPPTTSPPSPPADNPPPATSPPSPPADNPPPPENTPSPPADTPPPTTTPPAPPADTPPPTTTPTPPAATPPANSPPAPPPPASSSPSPPSPPSPAGGARSSPPPPSRTVVSPPGTPAVNDGSSSSPSPSNDGGISTGVVVGIAIAGVLILALISLVCVCCFKKKKKKRREEHYGPPPPLGPKADLYGGPMQHHHWLQKPLPPPDHVLDMPPKLTPPPGGAPRAPSPPLAGAYISSSGGSGSNYSGGEPFTPASPGMAFAFAKSSFSYDELAMATDGFSEANLLGQGGFGYVHRGVLPNGKEVAIKQLKAGSGQGEREFQAEVEIISRVHHKHLVTLVGYCITGSSRMLVYEFVPNNTLEFHLHGKGRPTMDWGSRLKIAVGSAKGLAYLHEDCHPKIIHRDIKAANILMDFNFEPKVADFGLAKFSPELNTHVSTRVMGTFGYLAPEYASSGKLTDKSDVFSFGVVLLELITGRRPLDPRQMYADDSLVDWARPLLTRSLEDNNFDALVDERIHNEYNQNEMARMVACAAACVRHSAKRRPRMSQVVRALDGDVSLSDLNEGIKPGHSTVYGSHESSDYDQSQYNEDMVKFRKMALASQEYANSEYSGGVQTSEYGLNPSASSSEGQTTRELTSREMELAQIKKDSKGYSSGY